MTLTPAYGRDYTSGKAAKADFDAGKDFIIADISSEWNGLPVNKPQFAEDSNLPAQVNIRFKQLRGVTVAYTRRANK